MSTTPDLDDTANLPILREPVQIMRAKIVTLETSGNDCSADEAKTIAETDPHPYAASIIRCYRARTTLDANQRHYRKAWSYLDSLSPLDFPRIARREFVELTRFVRAQDAAGEFDGTDFTDRVHSLAGLIDEFVDALNSTLEK